MKSRFVVTIAMAALAVLPAMSGDWKSESKALMSQGEFAKAEQVMRNEPVAVQRAHAVEMDSLRKVMRRIRKDFSISPYKGVSLIENKLGRKVTTEEIARWKANNYIESMTIDGIEWWMRKTERNFMLLNKELDPKPDMQWYGELEGYAAEAAATERDAAGVCDRRLMNITFMIDVDADAVPAGETLRVWMPVPFENARQSDVKILGSNGKLTLSKGSVHHTAYMEKKAVKGEKTHFEVSYSYVAGVQYFTRDELLAGVKAYDTSKPDYVKFTAQQLPHIPLNAKYEQLAHEIVGGESNPVLQASKIYDWIVSQYPWAGAREYSTIDCIPDYVLGIGHGDCGQVALLYITLCRNIGIPARWESGWMLHPGSKNLHDWAETYFEGIGWVPTDVSFGRTTYSQPIGDYYKSSLDVWRMAANEGVCGEFSPKKKFIRCETVDSQAGEVEWRGGNLEYDKWDYTLKINSSDRMK